MHVVFARNVNDAYRRGMELIHTRGRRAESRNGGVLRVPMPVTSVYHRPTERVLFDAQRNANPFFHLFEALWMLNGQNDVATLAQFLPHFTHFSDDGATLHGAYGHRWRHWPNDGSSPASHSTRRYDAWEIDQLRVAIGMLRTNHDDHRVVISMWDPAGDLGVDSKDIPCNDLIKFNIIDSMLNMQVFCRSNDAIWGYYGANAVHMSVLQEYVAAMVGVSVGTYYQISADFHAYVDAPYKWATYWPITIPETEYTNPYACASRTIETVPLVTHPELFDTELMLLMDSISQKHLPFSTFSNAFFRTVAVPMYRVFHLVKAGQLQLALADLEAEAEVHPIDWYLAGIEWIARKIAARSAKEFHWSVK